MMIKPKRLKVVRHMVVRPQGKKSFGLLLCRDENGNRWTKTVADVENLMAQVDGTPVAGYICEGWPADWGK